MNETTLNIAQELARLRESKGLSLTQLSAKTKIAERFIEAMEKGDFSYLPLVYVRAFLRTLSIELGLDPEVMVRQLLAASGAAVKDEEPTETEIKPPAVIADIREISAAPATSQIETSGDGRSKDNRMIILGSMAVLAVIMIALAYFFFHPNGADAPTMDTGTVVEKQEPGVSADTTLLVPLQEESKPDVKPADVLNLTIKATDTAWVRIVYRDSLTDEGMFAPGDGRSWTGSNQFFLKIGNAGAVRLYLDGQDLGAAGDRGRTAGLLINKEGMKKITDAEFPAAMNLPNTRR